MSLFNWFRAKTRSSRTDAEGHRQIALALSNIRAKLSRLDDQIGTIHIALRKHEDEITECKDTTARHDKTMVELEQLVDSSPAQIPPYTHYSTGKIMDTSHPPIFKSPTCVPAHKLDIDQFTEQQKRLLSVFFQNKDRYMSYADVAAVLGKSAYTIKNQMNQIKHKADLFDCVIGPQSRNFFRLKDNLKVERLLKVDQPLSRPVSIPGSDSSAQKHVAIPMEQPFSHSEG